MAKPPKTISAFRLLLWLKWTLMFRGFRRDKMRLIGTIIMLIVFTPLSLGLAAVCWYMCANHPPLIPYIALMALGFAYLVWLITPLLGFPLNESYDPTRLFIYPVSYRTIFLAAAVGGCLDVPTLLILPVFVALILAAAPNILAGIACFLLFGLFLIQTIATAQALMLALIGFLRSRRFRDITMVLLPLFGMTFYVLQQTAVRRFDLFITGFRDIVTSPVWKVLQWLPPGWAQSGMMAARSGNYGLVLLDLVLLAAMSSVMAVAAAFAMRQLYLGERGVMVARPSSSSAYDPHPQPLSRTPNPPAPFPCGEGGANATRLISRSQPEARSLSLLGVGLPPALAAVIEKERRYLWREPQYKVFAINMIYTLVVFGLIIFLNPDMKFVMGPYGPFAGHMPGSTNVLMRGLISFRILGILLLASLPLVFNIFGGEGAAITVLFSFPTPRRYLFLGKNLVHAGVLAVLCTVGILVGCYFTGSMALAGLGILEMAVVLPVVLAAGNLISVRFPYRMVVRGQRWGPGGRVSLGSTGPGAGAGCGYAFIYALCYLATFAALLPAVIAVALPILLDAGALWVFVGLLAAVAYALGLYTACLYMAVAYLPSREVAIIERLVPSDT
jgi:ABC-2 type transport system permease protein